MIQVETAPNDNCDRLRDRRKSGRVAGYPGRVLLHLVLVAVGSVGVASPEAALAQLVAVALLAAIAETHHALAAAIRALHRVED